MVWVDKRLFGYKMASYIYNKQLLNDCLVGLKHVGEGGHSGCEGLR